MFACTEENSITETGFRQTRIMIDGDGACAWQQPVCQSRHVFSLLYRDFASGGVKFETEQRRCLAMDLVRKSKQRLEWRAGRKWLHDREFFRIRASRVRIRWVRHRTSWRCATPSARHALWLVNTIACFLAARDSLSVTTRARLPQKRVCRDRSGWL